jgi:hypothetical protein
MFAAFLDLRHVCGERGREREREKERELTAITTLQGHGDVQFNDPPQSISG